MMEEQDTTDDSNDTKSQRHYFIDLDWYRAKERSFVTLAATRMCSSRHDKKALKSEAAMLNALKQCCSKQQSFVAPGMPIQELIFRVFLANENQPQDLEQIEDKLRQWLAPTGTSKDVSAAKLERIIGGDSYYGLRPAPS